jgi:hypothetical protein
VSVCCLAAGPAQRSRLLFSRNGDGDALRSAASLLSLAAVQLAGPLGQVVRCIVTSAFSVQVTSHLLLLVAGALLPCCILPRCTGRRLPAAVM